MTGKRSYVSAVPGCLTQSQLRRQARDRMFLPQPPPPPILDAPRRRSAWADFPIGLEDDDPAVTMKDIVDKSDCATQCDLAFTAERPSFTAAGRTTSEWRFSGYD